MPHRPLSSLSIVATLTCVCLLLANATSANGSKTERGLRASGKTSFLILLADDTGSGQLGYNGGIATTPNIDKLAHGSSTIVFTNFHSSPVCSPSRTALYSGQTPEVNCVPGVDESISASDSMTTIASDATKAGYKTAFFGKWHLGKVLQNSLGTKGFQHWTASPHGLLSYDSPCWCDEFVCNLKRLPKCRNSCYRNGKFCSAKASRDCWTGHMSLVEIQTHMAGTYSCYMMNGTTAGVIGRVFPPPDKHNCLFIAERASAYLKTLDPTDKFLMVVAFHETHIPFVADPTRRTTSEITHNLQANSPIANYVSVVETMDEAIGQVYSTLEMLDRTKDTFVLFAADNGPEAPDHGGVDSGTSFRGSKRTVFEGGIRVPAVLSWPQQINGNHHVRKLVHLVDIRATIRDIIARQDSSVKFPQESLSGFSLYPIIKDPLSQSDGNRSLLVCGQVGPGKNGICTTFAYFEEPMKVISISYVKDGLTAALFNISADPYEKTNLMTAFPALYTKLLRRGKTLAAKIRKGFIKDCGPNKSM